jgi:arylsulfatase A-like enzyme
VDVLPTLLELAAADRPAALDGESMLDVLCDPSQSTRETALLEYHRFAAGNNKNDTGYFPIRCAVGDDHKLVVNAHGSDELYDHTTDPGEVDNRIDDDALEATRERLHDAMLRLQRESRDPFYGRIWKDRTWRSDGELIDEELSMGSKGGDGFLPPSGTRLIWD